MQPEIAWLIMLLPLASFLAIAFVFRPNPKLSGYVSIFAIFCSFVLAVWAFATVVGFGEGEHALEHGFLWLTAGEAEFHLGLRVDALTAIMLVVVTSVSMLVQIYSQGYMDGDPGYSRYFAEISLFTMSMLGLVLADSLLMVFIFWELVGLCSYLLIGFWYQKPEAASAAKKAFLTTRIGDLGFLIAIVALFMSQHTLNIAELNEAARTGVLAGALLTWSAVGIFAGAVGKSAQFPLHVWLPDAMEGPTPVSALIHAATMVAAGVYLVARTRFLFYGSGHGLTDAMMVVAIIGGFTAIFAASMGLVMNDIKKVLAYSTVSQLGFMMLSLGVGGFVAGIFHLMNHAFFKALLFLGSGSVIHGTGTQDMREMGGLRKMMPYTYITFLIASLSIAGIFPLAGFWSKDEILLDVWNENQWLLLAMAVTAAFMTAFYMFRIIFMTFHGEYRGPAAQPAVAAASAGHGSAHASGHDSGPGTAAGHDSGGHGGHGGHGRPHESPWVMLVPLLVLAVPSVASGWLNVNGWFASFLTGEHEEVHYNFAIMGVALGVSLLGIFIAYATYSAKWISAASVARTFAPIHTLLSNKYYLDDFNDWWISNIFLGLCRFLAWFDASIVDGVVNGVASLTTLSGRGIRLLENGRAQAYAVGIFLGLVVIYVGFLFRV